MDEARAVLDRLERIEALDREGASPQELLDELRGLVVEAERWARRERDGAAAAAVEACRSALAGADNLNPAFTFPG